jgi:hypothetical protein
MTIPGQPVSIQIPEALYRRLQRVAEVTCRPIEEVLTTTIDVALPELPDIPADLAADIAAMTMFSDEALWAAAESSLSSAQQRRLSQLTHAGGTRTLTAAEAAELASLLGLHDRSVLRRSRAFAILAQRGHQIPDRKDLPRAMHADN